MRKPHYFAKEEIAYLREIAPGRTTKEMTEMFNQHFGLSLVAQQIKSARANYKIRSGLDMKFQKGKASWNKGMKGIDLSGENGKKTQFKKGNIPSGHRPVGSERVSRDGYVELKVAEPNKWKHKHVYLWEQVHGPIPEKHVIFFLDQNKKNAVLENLRLLSRRELVLVNKMGLLSNDPQLNQAVLNLAKLRAKEIEARERDKEKARAERAKKGSK